VQPITTLIMQLHLFESFDLNLKACVTWKRGVHLGYRVKGNYYMSLYRINDFYVEVQYHTGYDGIASIQAFACEDDLELYLNQIDISKIFE
jgi:hypothetical protein